MLPAGRASDVLWPNFERSEREDRVHHDSAGRLVNLLKR